MAEKQVSEVFLNQVEFINNFEIDIRKLIISLSTGALFFSATLIEINPGTRQGALNTNLKISWIFLAVSIVSGVLGLIFSSKWFGNKILIDRSQEEKFKTSFFIFLTNIYRSLANFAKGVNIWSFILAVVFLVIFATNNF